MEPGADNIINHLNSSPDSKYLRVEHWKNEDDFEKLFDKVLVDELKLDSIDDVAGFNKSLGSIDGTTFQ